MKNSDFLDYNRLLNGALLGVVKTALKSTANAGLQNGHFFYVSFKTMHRGVMVPDFLKSQYPDTLTIILQHEFSGLSVGEREFAVNLSFDDRVYHIVVPFSAVVAFSDPSVNFSLSFTPSDEDELVPDNQPELSVREPSQGGDNIIPISEFLSRGPSEPEPA